MLVINPDECIDCGVCEPECPIEAIEAGSESNLKWQEINSQYSKIWSNINAKKEPLENADDHKNEENKFDKYFSKNSGN
jgi:ferredoxin